MYNIRQCNASNFRKGRNLAIKYIVVHYTGNNGDAAKDNADYFANNAGLNASAHYFVDEKEVWQSVPDADTAWHCGTSGAYRHPECRNDGSIGVELCSRRDMKYYFKEETAMRAVILISTLMDRHNIPLSNVLRHYDVTGKLCPAPFVDSPEAWDAFLERLRSLGALKAVIQERCGFSYPAGVWEVLDMHPYAAELYRKWAESYADKEINEEERHYENRLEDKAVQP